MPVSSKHGGKLSRLARTLGGVARNAAVLTRNLLCARGAVFFELAGLREDGQVGLPQLRRGEQGFYPNSPSTAM